MLYNPYMKGTGRIAIKFEDGEKCVISKCYIMNTPALLFTYTDGVMPPLGILGLDGEKQLIDFSSDKVIVMCTEMKVLDNAVELRLMIQTNVYTEDDTNSYADFMNYLLSVAEPEEEDRTIFYNYHMENIKSIIADPDFFIMLLNEGVITGSEDDLRKHDLLPNIRLYKGGKSKQRLKSMNKKVKYIK